LSANHCIIISVKNNKDKIPFIPQNFVRTFTKTAVKKSAKASLTNADNLYKKGIQ
jgi:hypothetical protein